MLGQSKILKRHSLKIIKQNFCFKFSFLCSKFRMQIINHIKKFFEPYTLMMENELFNKYTKENILELKNLISNNSKLAFTYFTEILKEMKSMCDYSKNPYGLYEDFLTVEIDLKINYLTIDEFYIFIEDFSSTTNVSLPELLKAVQAISIFLLDGEQKKQDG